MFRTTAHLYDLIYEANGKDYAAESETIRDIITAQVPHAQSLLDVACGTGRHLRHLRSNFEVVGLDLDPSMLECARQRVPEESLAGADMRSFDLGRTFDVVICLSSSIGYLQSTADLNAAIATMTNHLAPGGLLILDGWLRPDAWISRGTTHLETAVTPEFKVARVSRAHRDGMTTYLDMQYLVASADGVEHLVDHHVLTMFDPEQYERALQSAGLSFEVVAGPNPGRDRYVATRP